MADLAGRRGGERDETDASSGGRSWRDPLGRRPNLLEPKKLSLGDLRLLRSESNPGIGGSEVSSFSAATISAACRPRKQSGPVASKPTT